MLIFMWWHNISHVEVMIGGLRTWFMVMRMRLQFPFMTFHICDYMVEWNKSHGIYDYIYMFNDMAIFIYLYFYTLNNKTLAMTTLNHIPFAKCKSMLAFTFVNVYNKSIQWTTTSCFPQLHVSKNSSNPTLVTINQFCLIQLKIQL
jgi:hypothetical protein